MSLLAFEPVTYLYDLSAFAQMEEIQKLSENLTVVFYKSHD